MIEFIKEYGVTDLDYSYIMTNMSSDLIEEIALSEDNVRDILDYFNCIGIAANISKIIIGRPDLLFVDKSNLIESIEKLEEKVFLNIIDLSVDDLVLLGI